KTAYEMVSDWSSDVCSSDLTFSVAQASAAPPTAMPRLPKVPMPYCTTEVSPWTTNTSSIETPSMSATIWANDVSSPWPCGEMPVSTVTLPVGSTRTVALSHPPDGSAIEGPIAQIST